MKYLVFILFIASMFLVSCNASEFEENTSTKDGKEYLNLVEGKYQIFRYDTIFYRGFKRDTFSGYIKREIGDPFLLANGQESNKLLIYWKKDLSDPFELKRVETIRIDNNRLIESDDGLNFIKLVFPLSNNLGWFGNSLFDNSEDIIEIVYGESVETIKRNSKWRYRVDAIDVPLEYGDLSFDRGLIINQVADTTNIGIRTVREYYASGVGLVGKHMTILSKTDSTTDPIVDVADKGYILNLEIIEHN